MALPSLLRTCAVALLGASSFVASACRESNPADVAPTANASTAPPPKRLVFPDALRVEDDSVNRFVEEAMEICVGGDYEPFRLLWSVEYEPIDRAHFEKHWQSIQRIDVLALEGDPDPDARRYALCADVVFDPDALPPDHELQNDPRRRVVLLIIHEQDRWRLTRASKPVRQWLLQKVAESRGEPPPSEATEPADPDLDDE